MDISLCIIRELDDTGSADRATLYMNPFPSVGLCSSLVDRAMVSEPGFAFGITGKRIAEPTDAVRSRICSGSYFVG